LENRSWLAGMFGFRRRTRNDAFALFIYAWSLGFDASK
jgi:hypothetical protein